MSLDSNSGTQYYKISCNVPSDVGLNVNSNAGSSYMYREANDYILWGQDDQVYPQPQTNIGTQYYFLSCGVPSDSGLDLESNAGTHYYYSSAFNCVGFCD